MALSLFVILPTLSAQVQPQPLVGSRVRIAHHCDGERAGVVYVGCRRASGTIVSLDVDSMVIRASETGDWLAVPLGLVNHVEVRQGEKRNIVEGAALGLFGGAVFGLLGEATCSGWMCGGEFALIAAGVFGAAGLVIGGTIGAFVMSDTWREVPLDGMRVSIVPRQNGIALGFSFAL